MTKLCLRPTCADHEVQIRDKVLPNQMGGAQKGAVIRGDGAIQRWLMLMLYRVVGGNAVRLNALVWPIPLLMKAFSLHS